MLNKQIRQWIASRVGAIKEATLVDEQGCTSQVQKISTASGCYILKSATKDKYRAWLKTEAEVLERLANHSIPLPRYFGFYEDADASHLLMSFEEGMTLTSALKQAASTEEKQDLMRSFGQLLYDLHTLPAPTPKQDWLTQQLELSAYYLQQGEADGDAQLLEQLNNHKPIQIDQTLIHGDCTPDNVLVQAGKVTLFIDVAAMTVGDPRHDVALALRRCFQNDVLKTAFYQGYGRQTITDDEFRYFHDGLYEFF
ncbi:hypothetical protein JCM19046_2609 [Bacillus sp. JCM 19046]|nr:hypothetical protein JCM19045_771 [Bacillus sp. JCM 19045]GAF18060.1 hypothetical protein JCM19046_2609 [Bacillus sp. JCM 19046]